MNSKLLNFRKLFLVAAAAMLLFAGAANPQTERNQSGVLTEAAIQAGTVTISHAKEITTYIQACYTLLRSTANSKLEPTKSCESLGTGALPSGVKAIQTRRVQNKMILVAQLDEGLEVKYDGRKFSTNLTPSKLRLRMKKKYGDVECSGGFLTPLRCCTPSGHCCEWNRGDKESPRCW